jgi:tetratricopeptide (TPR) repeat protein
MFMQTAFKGVPCAVISAAQPHNLRVFKETLMKSVALFAAALVSSLALAAGTLQDAQKQYADGDFTGAATAAAALNTSDGFALAAKANSIFASTQPENKQEALYSQSEKYARSAVKLDDRNEDAYFEVARALGRLSQLRGVLAALTQGLGGQIKDNLDKALKIDPQFASALVALGLWHAEIVGKGVAFLYGADADKGINAFNRAIKLEPNVIIHRVEFARGMMLIDSGKYKADAIKQLEVAVTLTPRDAAEKLDLERAKRDLAALKK